MADAGYLTIGKVVRRLQEQYPDLSISKVRYLEDEGLLTPSRTPGGYRLYSSRDIQRLETILYLQKTKFLPLSVIKDELDGRTTQEESTPEEMFGASRERASRISPELADEMHPIDRIPELLGVSLAGSSGLFAHPREGISCAARTSSSSSRVPSSRTLASSPRTCASMLRQPIARHPCSSRRSRRSPGTRARARASGRSGGRWRLTGCSSSPDPSGGPSSEESYSETSAHTSVSFPS